MIDVRVLANEILDRADSQSRDVTNMALNTIAATAMNQQPSVDSRSSRTSVWSG
jgi:uncharacterized phage-associated protein